MIKTITATFCDSCNKSIDQFYTLTGMVYCSEYDGNAIKHFYQVAMMPTHVCDECFKNAGIKFENKLSKYEPPIVKEENEIFEIEEDYDEY